LVTDISATTSKTTYHQNQRKSVIFPSNHGNNNISGNRNSTVDNYIKSIKIMNKSTSYEYFLRLNSFIEFIKNEFDGSLGIDDLLTRIKQGLLDPYDILSKYSGYLQNSCNISTL
jgi:hypothetical protein